jgi:hypothetical protein
MQALRSCVFGAAVCGCVLAQGTAPKKAAAEYETHASLNAGEIGAENLGHSLSTAKGVIDVRDYLVIEVALYSKTAPLAIRNEQFLLRINGRKVPISPQTPGFVAASLKYPDWEQRPHATAGVGLGNGGVILGQPTPVPRFPGDPTPRTTRTPVPRAPTDTSGVEKAAPETIEETINRLALPEGETHPPVSGYLFFGFQGKLKSIKTLDLEYKGPAGSATLRLP